MRFSKMFFTLWTKLCSSNQTVGEAFDVAPAVTHLNLGVPMQKRQALNMTTHLWLGWWQSDRRERFGQYVINRTAVRGADPVLFFEEDAEKAHGYAADYLQRPVLGAVVQTESIVEHVKVTA